MFLGVPQCENSSIAFILRFFQNLARSKPSEKSKSFPSHLQKLVSKKMPKKCPKMGHFSKFVQILLLEEVPPVQKL